MAKGFSMLSKELMDSEYYFSERFTRMQAYLDLCLLAEWKDRKFIKRGQIVELKAGQLAKSEEELASRWKWSRNTVRKYLNEQQSIGNIEQRKSRLITIITVKFGLNIAQQIEQQTPLKTEQQIEQLTIDNNIYNIIENNIKEKETNVSSKKDEKDELFEECWKAYKRKGKKKKSLEQWKKLSDDERQQVLPHIRQYVASRDLQFQQDFERYLRDRTFKGIIVKGNTTLYDPEQSSDKEYRPTADGVFLYWDEKNKRLIFNGDIEHLNDGYTSDNRPDGATVAWGMYEWKWSRNEKRWVKDR